MIPEKSAKSETLTIAEQAYFNLGDYQLEIISYLGCFTPNVHSFKVSIQSLIEQNEDEEQTNSSQQLGLLRVGSLDSGLNRELKLRELLTNYGLIAPLIAHDHFESVLIDTTIRPLFSESENPSIDVKKTDEKTEDSESISDVNPSDDSSDTLRDTPIDQPEVLKNINQDLEEKLPKNDDNFYLLDEEYLPEEIYEDEPQEPSEQLLLLTDFPSLEESLEQFLKKHSSQENALNSISLNLVIQLGQCCSYLADRKWNLVNLVPSLIEFKKRLKLYDLTQIFPEQETTSIGLSGGYCAPELATVSPINSLMSSYTVGAVLYQIIHHKLPNIEQNLDFPTEPIPRFYQLLKKVLSPVPEERFTLAGLRQLLLEAREEISTPKIVWKTASCSTVGLSLDRLQNEDNFGIRQQKFSETQTLTMGIVADGIGGIAKGEVASKIAVETLLKESIPTNFKSPEQRDTWLVNIFEKANQAIASEVDNAGTTLSVVLAVNEQLMVAHVGDSRIYLLRQGKLQQISQDHSYVASLVNNGKITEEESRNHPDRNVLLRSLGSKTPLRNGHVQNLTVTTNQLVLTLENKDILLLCSDGVWDLVSNEQLQKIFTNPDTSLQEAVDTTIQKVLNAGASDNATLLALQYIDLSFN